MSELPSVSVILPVRNEAASISATLDSILRQDYEGPLEIHAVDGASEDATPDILDRYASEHPQLSWSTNQDGSTPRSLNQAIAQTSGEVVVRCDGRSVLPSAYVATAVRVLLSTGASNVGGRQNAVGEGVIQRAVAMATTSPFGAGDARFRVGGAPGPVDTVYLGVFRREILESVGGFDETFVRNQDTELNSRIRKAGGVVYFTPELIVDYSPRADLPSVARQYFEYGRWRRATSRAHPEHLGLRQLAAPSLVIALAASLLAMVLGLWALGSIVPLVYAGFLVVAAVTLLVNRRDWVAVMIPVVLVVIHLSWGTGFLIGPPR